MGNLRRSSAVSDVPQSVDDIEALSGAWKRSQIPPKTAQEFDQEKIWELRRSIALKIWRTNKLEQEVTYNLGQLKELKQSILYDFTHVDKEIFDYGIGIAKDESYAVRKAPELVDRWVKEATSDKKEMESREQNVNKRPSSIDKLVNT